MRRGPDPRALGISLALHAVVLLPLVVFARPPEPIQFETYRVNLVAAPEMREPQPAPPPDDPEPRPTPVEPEAQPEPEPEPEAEAREQPPEPEREREPDVEKPPDTPEPRPEPTDEAPDDTDVEGNAPIDLSTEGLEFPFPDYLANISTQLYRYIRWKDEGSRPRGTVYFEILPDGSVRNIRMAKSSGNIRFDFTVQGAVETAGQQGAFGPLPDAYANPYLPVLLEVEPPR